MPDLTEDLKAESQEARRRIDAALEGLTYQQERAEIGLRQGLPDTAKDAAERLIAHAVTLRRQLDVYYTLEDLHERHHCE